MVLGQLARVNVSLVFLISASSCTEACWISRRSVDTWSRRSCWSASIVAIAALWGILMKNEPAHIQTLGSLVDGGALLLEEVVDGLGASGLVGVARLVACVVEVELELVVAVGRKAVIASRFLRCCTSYSNACARVVRL